jgi:two-component system phosphate regulon sensor histidine kinase PhoR
MATQDLHSHQAHQIWEYDLLFRNTSDGALILDQHRILLRINPAAAAMLRCVPGDCLGKQVEVVFKGQPALLTLLVGKGEITGRVPLPDRRVATGIADDQQGGGRLVLLRDVTERDALDSRREQLIRSLAHDLRNPVSAIEGFADLVPMYGPLNADQQRFVARLKQTSRKLIEIAPILVDLTWVKAGMPMDNVPLRLDKVIREAVRGLTSFARDKQMTIAVSTQEPMPPIMGDSTRLRQAIYHLVHNAILYSNPEQTVAIHAFCDGHQVQCAVADQGIGIEADELPLIFDRFYRAKDDRVRNLPGGGLGLTLAQAIIARHGGTILAESVYGQGCTFTFSLPTS